MITRPGTSVIVACVVAALSSWNSIATAAELSPVWTLDMASGMPVVTTNELESKNLPPFPLESILLHQTRRPKPDMGPDIVLYAPLHLSKSGAPTNDLAFVRPYLISHGSFGDEPVVIFGSSWSTPDELGRRLLQATRAVPEKVRGFEQSPRSNIGVLLQQYSTQLVNLQSDSLLVDIPFHVYEVAYARSSDAVAVLTLHLDQGEDHFRGNEQSQIVVFDYAGRKLFESPLSPPGHPYQQVYLNPAGTWLMVTQRGPDYSTIATDYVTLCDVKSGECVRLPGLSGGLRWHSMDGNFMALVQTGSGKIWYYQLSSNGMPRQLWTWTHEGLIASAAVNHDGSLVAVVDNDSVVVLNRQGNIIASGTKSRDEVSAMMFVGDYLIVGATAAMVPAYYWQIATDRIDAYFLGTTH